MVRCPSDRGMRPAEKSKQDWKGSAELGEEKRDLDVGFSTNSPPKEQ